MDPEHIKFIAEDYLYTDLHLQLFTGNTNKDD
jgi:hypothetical protein